MIPITSSGRPAAPAYQEKLRNSQPYLEYLLDRAAADHDLSKDDGRRAFLSAMLTVAARIPDAAARDQFADRLAHKARITEEVVRAEIRKAAVQRQTDASRSGRSPSLGQVKPAERGLIWALMQDPAGRWRRSRSSTRQTSTDCRPRRILQQARSLQGWPADSLPETLLERLSKGEAALVDEICRQPSAPADRGGLRPGPQEAAGSTGSARRFSAKSTGCRKQGRPPTDRAIERPAGAGSRNCCSGSSR